MVERLDEVIARSRLRLDDLDRLREEAGLVTDTKWGLAFTTLGCFFADEIVQQFFEPHHLPFPPDDYAPGPLHPLNNNQAFDQPALQAAE